jgi:hypothetical protein
VAATEWRELSFNLEEACAGFELISAVTLQNNTEAFPFLLDSIEFKGARK